MTNKKTPTLQECKDLYKSIFYMEDDSVIDLIVAVAIGSVTNTDPIWLLLIGGSSSGKSELINILSKCVRSNGKPLSFSVDSLTDNTFLSAASNTDGKEKSLLHRMGTNGLMLMKDYTTILSMPHEKRESIIGQMRKIYDGEFTKETGSKSVIPWRGKINWIGAVTDTIYLKEGESAGMGRRTINYIMKEQDRIKTAKAVRKNAKNMPKKRIELQDMFSAYIKSVIDTLGDGSDLPDVPEEVSDQLIELADFATIARTPTQRDYKSMLTFVNSHEGNMRVFQQLLLIGQILQYINGGVLSPEHEKLLYTVALDSIPKQRMLALDYLATYNTLTSKGLAHLVYYPTDQTRTWLEDLAVLRVVKRYTDGGKDRWQLLEKYRKLLQRYRGIEPIDTDFDHTGDAEQYTAPQEKNLSTNPLFYTPKEETDDPGYQKELLLIDKAKADNDLDTF